MTTDKQGSASCFQHLKDLYRLVRSDPTSYKNAFNEYETVRRKYILTQVCERLDKDPMEPAPLLGTTLLDIGCGDSDMAKEMVFRGAEVTALDVSEDAIKKAEAKANKAGAPMRFIQGKPESLIQNDEKFDIILCLDVLSYIEDKDKFAWAVGKLLNNGGLVIFSERHGSFWSRTWHTWLAEKKAKWVPEGTYSSFDAPQQSKVIDFMKKKGFNILSLQDISFNLEHKKWVKDSCTAIRYMGVAEKK